MLIAGVDLCKRYVIFIFRFKFAGYIRLLFKLSSKYYFLRSVALQL